MANTIRIKRSATTATPLSLEQGELAYSESTGVGSGELFIGIAGASLEKIAGFADVQKLVTIESGANVTNTATVTGAGAVMDVDFSSNGFMRRTAAGVYAVSSSIDASSEIVGNLSVGNLNSGTNATALTFWRGDGVWAVPLGAGDVSGAGSSTDNAIARWNLITGTLIQDSVVTIADTTGNMAGVGTLNGHTIQGGAGTFALTSDVTYEQLNTNGDVGTGVGQLAIGNHNHSGVYEPVDATIIRTGNTSVAGWSFVADEDDMASNSNILIPTQQSVKAYIDASIAGGVTYKGGYNAATNVPDLDTIPTGGLTGDMYTVTVAGTFFTVAVEAGDVLIAQQDSPTLEAHWTIVNKNLDSVASSGIVLTAGIGLIGGGDLTAARTFDLDLNSLTTVTSAGIDGSTDFVPFYEAGVGHKKILANDMMDGGTF